jgi:hypothetical protein
VLTQKPPKIMQPALNKGAINLCERQLQISMLPEKIALFHSASFVECCYSVCSVVAFLRLNPLNFSFAVKIFSVANSRDAMYIMTTVKAAT